MLLALLAVLGVNLAVIAAVLVLVLARRRWVLRQPRAFRSALRVREGEVRGAPSTWRRGYGRWVGGVLVWTKAPLHLRNVFMAIESVDEPRRAPGTVKRLGDHPVAVRLQVDGATVELAAAASHVELLLGPCSTTRAAP